MQDTDCFSDACAHNELAGWIRLAHTSGIGPGAARALLAAFGLPQHVFAAGFAALQGVVRAGLARALSAPAPGAMAQLVEATLAWLAEPMHAVVTLADPAYPSALLEIADPPVLLYAAGRLELLARPAVAVVGSRNASLQGAANAQAFGAALSEAGLTIISGLALGIDAAAHAGGLRGAGSTIAVVGTGADIVYPARNRSLAHAIAQQGCILSEYPLGMPAIAGNFPRRNRLISGLARAVLVVEAAARSGSLITARLAAEQGRDVFAIPGSIHSALSKGCHGLIKQGAKLVESAQDVLEEMRIAPPGLAAPALAALDEAGGHAALLAALGHDPVHGDTLAARMGARAGELDADLLMLELAGQVERLAGGLLQRVKR